MARLGDRPARRSVEAALLAGGALVLVSGFLPWFIPADGSYGVDSSGWGHGPLAALAIVLGVGLLWPACLPAAARWVPPLRRALERVNRPPLSARAGAVLSGTAVAAVLVVWLVGASFTDPALPGPGQAPAPGGSSAASWPGGDPVMPGVAGAGLYAALVGTTVELACCLWLLRRSVPLAPFAIPAR